MVDEFKEIQTNIIAFQAFGKEDVEPQEDDSSNLKKSRSLENPSFIADENKVALNEGRSKKSASNCGSAKF